MLNISVNGNKIDNDYRVPVDKAGIIYINTDNLDRLWVLAQLKSKNIKFGSIYDNDGWNGSYHDAWYYDSLVGITFTKYPNPKTIGFTVKLLKAIAKQAPSRDKNTWRFNARQQVRFGD